MKNIMKKIALITLMISLLFGQVCPTEAANSVNKQVGKEYARILKRYLQVRTAVKKNYSYSAISLSTDNKLVSGFHFDGLGDIYNVVQEFMWELSASDTICYSIKDFNRDGTPELFVANTKGKIYNVFTFKNGKAVYLMGSGDGTYKTVLGKNGVIAKWVEGGDRGNVWLDKIGKNKKLKRVVTLWSYQDGKPHYMQYKNGKDIEIGKSRYQNLIKKNCKPIKLKFYKADNKAVKKIKQGKFSYKHQKAWNIKNKI